MFEFATDLFPKYISAHEMMLFCLALKGNVGVANVNSVSVHTTPDKNVKKDKLKFRSVQK